MIQLGRHIEILLLDNDCVIVPDFGGFVAHHVSARYDEDDHSWLPPMRTLGFNAQLRINDSLLAQSYVNAYDISYPEALRRIENEVEELKQLLANEGCYTMDDIGTLTINDEGNYQFEPCEAGILSPAYYGLDACSFVTLKEARGMNAANVALQASTEPVELPQPTSSDSPALLDFADNGEPEEEHVIRIKMSWVRNIAAIAAAVIAFFVMATPIANSDLRTRAMSDLKGNLLYKLIPQDTNMAPATPIAESVQQQTAELAKGTDTVKIAETAKVAEKADSTAQPQATATATDKTYCIVLASHVRKDNAHRNVVRVVYGSYKTEAEAYKQLNRLTDKEEFFDAWVYKKAES